MADKIQKLRVGMFAGVTLVLAAIVVVVFGGMRFWETTDRYCIVFASSVMGLEPGAEVYLNGVKVGTVKTVEVATNDIRNVAVAIAVKHGTPIHSDTHAMLQLAGITGLKVIDLRDGSAAAPALPPGSQIAAGSGLLDKLEAQAETIVEQTKALMQRANHLTDNLIAFTDNLGTITGPATVAANNLAAVSVSLKAMVDDNRVALRQSLAAIETTANGASQLIDGQVAPLLTSAGEVVSQLKSVLVNNEAPLRAAVFDLRQASRSFKELARDVRQKPSRLLFSSEPAERRMP